MSFLQEFSPGQCLENHFSPILITGSLRFGKQQSARQAARVHVARKHEGARPHESLPATFGPNEKKDSPCPLIFTVAEAKPTALGATQYVQTRKVNLTPRRPGHPALGQRNEVLDAVQLQNQE